MVPQMVRNDVSSTKVRLFIRKGLSIEYLLPGCVSKYIRRHHLYKDGLVSSPDGQPSSFPPLEIARARNDSDASSGESSGEELCQES